MNCEMSIPVYSQHCLLQDEVHFATNFNFLLVEQLIPDGMFYILNAQNASKGSLLLSSAKLSS